MGKGKRRENGHSPRETIKPPSIQKQQSPDAIQDGISRRVAIGGIALGVAAAITGWKIFGSKPETPADSSQNGKKAQSPEAKQDSKILNILPETNVPVPTFEEVEKNVPLPFSIPESITAMGIDPESFRQKMMNTQFDEWFRSELQPKFKNGVITQKEFWDSLNLLLPTNKYLSAIGKDVNNFSKTTPKADLTLQEIFTIFNDYLLHANLYLDSGDKNEENSFDADVFKVSKVARFRVEDETTSDEILVVSVRDGVGNWRMKETQKTKAGTAAEYNYSRGYCVFIQDVANVLYPMNEAISRKYNDLNAVGKPFEDILGGSYLRHELTHGFLRKKFPHASKRITKINQPTFDLGVDMQPLRSSNKFDALELHELGAVAVELATSEERCHNRLYLNGHWDTIQEGDSYHLNKVLIPVAILKVAKDSGLRSQALKDLESGKINYPVLKQIYTDPNWTIEDTKKVGQYLYNFAHKALAEIDLQMKN